ncbi:hypothetical protein K0U83_16990 [bacterium]|nr:hypothetical protein [bacterium]
MTESKKRRSRRQAGKEAPATGSAPESAPAPEVKVQTAPKVEEHVPTFTASMWMGPGGDPIATAFLTVEKMENGTRKLPASDWQKIWEEFVSKGRN